VASQLEDATEVQEGFFPNDDKTQKYGNLMFLLQSEPRHIAHLCRLVTMAEIDALLQTVMFTIYGNQYESREEHLLLTMFQVGYMRRTCTKLFANWTSFRRSPS
jgi:Ras GTPase-activating-like protein IQGAP2/3